jgi:hypothetical protein
MSQNNVTRLRKQPTPSEESQLNRAFHPNVVGRFGLSERPLNSLRQSLILEWLGVWDDFRNWLMRAA